MIVSWPLSTEPGTGIHSTDTTGRVDVDGGTVRRVVTEALHQVFSELARSGRLERLHQAEVHAWLEGQGFRLVWESLPWADAGGLTSLRIGSEVTDNARPPAPD